MDMLRDVINASQREMQKTLGKILKLKRHSLSSKSMRKPSPLDMRESPADRLLSQMMGEELTRRKQDTISKETRGGGKSRVKKSEKQIPKVFRRIGKKDKIVLASKWLRRENIEPDIEITFDTSGEITCFGNPITGKITRVTSIKNGLNIEYKTVYE